VRFYNMKFKKVFVPFVSCEGEKLKAGDIVLLSGIIYTARDAAHKRMVREMGRLPINIKGQTIYYAGPAPARPKNAIGSCGPTTSSRMDAFVPVLLNNGLKSMIGKGKRSQEVVAAIKKYKAVYFVAIGGCGALLSKKIKGAKIVAYKDLGPEAVYRLEIKNFPVIVGIDSCGKSIFKN